MAGDLKEFKLFPRNLTARAELLVRGNPVTTRPESGVENCFPGLEFDQRNLDSVFFPGLHFEMHHTAGVVLRDFSASAPAAQFVRHEDIQRGIFLVYLKGWFASRIDGVQPSERILRFTPPAGLDSWRFVRDLEIGDVALVLCDGAALARVANGALDTDAVSSWLTNPQDRLERAAGVGDFVLLFGKRARYLTIDGVIDPQALQPGQLTRSLCSPWQYDFADCGCFYWASNKPDLVSSEAQPAQILNFQRRDRSPEGDLAATADDWVLKHDNRWDGDAAIVRHAEMLTHWKTLPFVVRRREVDRYIPIVAKPFQPLLDRKAIIDRLSRLAPVEHALAIEYLYAHYSLGIPLARPADLKPSEALVHTAGSEVFQIAIDEMRHMRSVNEILIELGAPWQLDRAKVIGEDFDGTGRAFNRLFSLRPLTRDQQDWFIAVEQASQNQDDQNSIDGMYTLILRSVQASGDFSAEEKSRISSLIKVIIDEGINHFERFSRVKRALAGIASDEYLKVKAEPTRLDAGDPDSILQDAVDAAYLVVLRSLDYVFAVGDDQRGALMESARRAMYNMDDAARSLAARAKGALFDYSRFGVVAAMPLGVPSSGVGVSGAAAPGPAQRRQSRVQAAQSLGDPLRLVLDQLGASGVAEHAVLADRMRQRLLSMTNQFVALAATVR